MKASLAEEGARSDTMKWIAPSAALALALALVLYCVGDARAVSATNHLARPAAKYARIRLTTAPEYTTTGTTAAAPRTPEAVRLLQAAAKSFKSCESCVGAGFGWSVRGPCAHANT